MGLRPQGGKNSGADAYKEWLAKESHFSVPCQVPPERGLGKRELSFPSVFSRADST